MACFSLSQLLDYYGRDVPFPIKGSAEVSRFGICKQARKRKDGAVDLRSARSARTGLRRAEPLMSLGLIQGLVRMSLANQITHWCAVMEPQLLRMLGAMGIHFVSVGALVEHHGKRQLCYCDVRSMLATAMTERPSFWKIMTDGGKLAYGL